AFVENKKFDRFRLIDTNGNYVSTHEFDQYAPTFNDEPGESFFENGEVYVSVDDAWGIINRDGTFTAPLTDISGDADYDSFQQVGEYLMYYDDAGEGYLYGFCNLKTNVIVPPIYTAINFDTLHNELIHVELNDTMIYLNQKGATVWKENSSTEELKPFNIFAMNRGYFYASSPSVAELNGFGGWATSENQFQKAKKQSFPKNKFGISVTTETIVPYNEKYKGHQLYVYNTTKDSIFFNAQDSRLYMNIQAKDEDGTWKDIEYIPSSWCGNSYHNVFLAKNSFWEFTIPKYEGAIATKLRVKLLYKSDHKDKESQVLYSEEFDGSINPAQFWYKGNYIPSGMMDPYYD
ncbi:MAG: WG repeat-containing protein, partial [Bacteroidota bacterium]